MYPYLSTSENIVAENQDLEIQGCHWITMSAVYHIWSLLCLCLKDCKVRSNCMHDPKIQLHSQENDIISWVYKRNSVGTSDHPWWKHQTGVLKRWVVKATRSGLHFFKHNHRSELNVILFLLDFREQSNFISAVYFSHGTENLGNASMKNIVMLMILVICSPSYLSNPYLTAKLIEVRVLLEISVTDCSLSSSVQYFFIYKLDFPKSNVFFTVNILWCFI